MKVINSWNVFKKTQIRFFCVFFVLGAFLVFGGNSVGATEPSDSFPTGRSVQDQDYVVRGVKIDITAKSAYEARKKAIKEAGLKGFEKLLETLVPPLERSKLVSSSLSDIEDYIETFEVSEEKISQVRYLATYSISFKPHKIKSLFARHGVTPSLQTLQSSEEAALPQNVKPALIVPVLIEGDKTLLWDERNPWFLAWSSLDLEETSLVVPVGDLKDVRDLSAEAARAGAVENIGTLLERYSLEQAFVAILDLSDTSNPSLEISQYSRDGLLRQATVGPFGEAGDSLKVIKHAQTKMKTLLHSLMGSFESLARLSEVSAQVLFSSLKEWHFIREKLELLPVVKEISVQSLKRSGATVSLKMIGTTEGFLSLLPKSDLVGERRLETGEIVLKKAPERPNPMGESSSYPGVSQRSFPISSTSPLDTPEDNGKTLGVRE